jgi:tetratricopeptide (TPR) repeat protein
MRKAYLYILLAVPVVALLAITTYYLPPVHSRLAWRVDQAILRAKYAVNPPEEVVFVPRAGLKKPAVRTIQHATATQPSIPTLTPTNGGPTPTPQPAPTATPIPTPLPAKVSLKGVRYEDQHGRWNYCAPANLAMALSYWGWKGNRDVVGPVIKPDPKDKNVMPYEMVDYVQSNTSLRAVERVGGDLEMLKRFLAAGYPVLIEKAAYFHDLEGVLSWMGHYQVVTGYNDSRAIFITQDSFTRPDEEIAYSDMETNWRGFNNTYIILYPPDKETEVLSLLGPDADETTNYQRAAQKASQEIYSLTGIDQYYAWYNRGTNLASLKDFAGAAQAYDNAFGVYPTIPQEDRPWRMLWYQTGPYAAYFYSGRYWDVIGLTETTLSTLQSEKNLEESYYWRGMARQALGDSAGAIDDFRTSLKYHPGFAPPAYQLKLLGLEP